MGDWRSHFVRRTSTEGKKQKSATEDKEFFCKCGVIAPIRTSWSSENPGRKFVGCGKYTKYFKCGSFDWVDPEVCSYGKEMLPGLFDKIRHLERSCERLYEQNTELAKENGKLKTELVKAMEFKEDGNEEKIGGNQKQASCSMFLMLSVVVSVLVCIWLVS